MKCNSITPMLETNSLQETILFYTKVLHFTLGDTLEHEGEMQWCTLYKDEIEIMFSLPNKVMNYGQILLSGSLYIRMEGVDEYWKKIKDNAPVVYPIEDFPYQMREFAIKDNNGYVLNFGQPIV